MLVFFATASAECTWVLWSEVDRAAGDVQVTVTTRWTVHAAFKTEEQCRAGAAKQAAAYAAGNKGTMSEDLRGPTVVVQGTDRMIVATYLCLPDTIDPRGPKR